MDQKIVFLVFVKMFLPKTTKRFLGKYHLCPKHKLCFVGKNVLYQNHISCVFVKTILAKNFFRFFSLQRLWQIAKNMFSVQFISDKTPNTSFWVITCSAQPSTRFFRQHIIVQTHVSCHWFIACLTKYNIFVVWNIRVF